jgi:hypothetical protein
MLQHTISHTLEIELSQTEDVSMHEHTRYSKLLLCSSSAKLNTSNVNKLIKTKRLVQYLKHVTV